MDHSGRSSNSADNGNHNRSQSEGYGNGQQQGPMMGEQHPQHPQHPQHHSQQHPQQQQQQQQHTQHPQQPQQQQQQQHPQQQQRYSSAPGPYSPSQSSAPSPYSPHQQQQFSGSPLAAAPKTPQQQQQRLLQMQQMQQQRQQQLQQIQRQQQQQLQQQNQNQNQHHQPNQQQQHQQQNQSQQQQNQPQQQQHQQHQQQNQSQQHQQQNQQHQQQNQPQQQQHQSSQQSQQHQPERSHQNQQQQQQNRTSPYQQQTQGQLQPSSTLRRNASATSSSSTPAQPSQRPSSMLAASKPDTNNAAAPTSSMSKLNALNSRMSQKPAPLPPSNTNSNTNATTSNVNANSKPAAFSRPLIPKGPNVSRPSSSTAAAAMLGSGGSVHSQSHSHSHSHSQSTFGQPPEKTEAETAKLLKECPDWIDRTLWATRQILGGQSVNGFLRSTATVQRIKKQRARQSAQTKSKATPEEIAAAAATAGPAAPAKRKRGETPDQVAEEVLKQEVMNSRTAKKIKTELEAGMQFCAFVHGAIRNIIQEMDVGLPPPPPLGQELPGTVFATSRAATFMPSPQMMPLAPNLPASGSAQMGPGTAKKKNKSLVPLTQAALYPRMSSNTAAPAPGPVAAAPGTSSTGAANGSTLRKHRKKKMPPSTDAGLVLPEFDDSGKRVCTKKEHTNRVFIVTRYRALRQGDFVAARVSSRDLWILARVVKDYPGPSVPPAEFLQLTDARRDQLFRDKVAIQDVEDKSKSAESQVVRSLILPLPRSFSEAAEWCQRYRKGTRVYAMYPHTTSLYTATVLDYTTYCREDDDIVVVEFDGDEPDHTGAIPKCHIPARFVTVIPREFPGAQTTSKKRRGSFSLAGAPGPNSNANAPAPGSDPFDGLFDGPLPGLDGFDDLDFDLLGGS